MTEPASDLRELLPWYRRHKRDLPWRDTQDPWAIWVSEVMLQQTRVETVMGYWARFLERFPTPAALALADEQEVLGLWQGLGYYRRARLLHQAAKTVVAEHGGRIPTDPATFLTLPGVGRYTAGAVMSIAFGLPEPIVDGNVIRVLSRVFKVRGDPRSTTNQKRLWALAKQVIPANADPDDVRDFNQALMELGATVCIPPPGRPHCLLCPLTRRCLARREGLIDELPEATRKAAIRPMRAACAILWDAQGRALFARRPDEGLLAGLWEFPGVPLAPEGAAPPKLVEGLRARVGVEVDADALTHLGDVTHVFTHRRLTLHAFAARAWTRQAQALDHYPEIRWIDPERCDATGTPLPKLTRKVLALLTGPAEPPAG